MIETMFLVPELDNAGRRFAREFWSALEARLMRAFGGFTERRGVRGAWVHGGRVYRDRSREFTVALDTWGQLPAWLAIVELARIEARQEAIYIRIGGIPEVWTGWPR